MKNYREPFVGRFYGIWNVEGDESPVALFAAREDAERELSRRRALVMDDDDYLTEYHQIFHADLLGVWWNSYEVDPRGDAPLDGEEIVDASRVLK